VQAKAACHVTRTQGIVNKPSIIGPHTYKCTRERSVLLFLFFLCILEMGEDSPDLALFFYGSIFREPHLHNMILQSTKPQWTLECGLVFEAVLFLHRQSLCNGVILLQLIYTSAVKCN